LCGGRVSFLLVPLSLPGLLIHLPEMIGDAGKDERLAVESGQVLHQSNNIAFVVLLQGNLKEGQLELELDVLREPVLHSHESLGLKRMGRGLEAQGRFKVLF